MTQLNPATGSAEELPPRIRAESARFRADSGGTAAEGLPPSQ